MPPVTQRYWVAVTLRYAEARAAVTQRYPEDEADAAATPSVKGVRRARVATLPPGSLLADGYRIEAGPLGGPSGEAEVYRCHDPQGDRTVAVKLYRYSAQPKQAVIAQLQGLSHPNIVSLMSHGQWQGRFYEVMEYCSGGVMADRMPSNEIQLRGYLPGIASGLNYCHRQGIVHRDVKPNNLFFRHPESTDVLIGDFGISSYLEEDHSIRVTQSASHLTLDYAAPELLDGHEVGPPTDYYALGVTLLHLLLGRSPFQGMSHNDILVAQLRGKLRFPDDLSDPFRKLLQGLTHYDFQHRWGYRELLGWLHGEEVRLAPTRPDTGRSRPYPGYPQADEPAQLAEALHRFDAEKQLFRGDIRRWVFDNFDQELANRIEPLEENYREAPAKALVKLTYLLDPQSPLRIGSRQVKSLAELVEVLARDHGLLSEAFEREAIESWIEAGHRAGDRTPELLNRIRAIRERLPHSRETALFALLYTLDPNQPLQLTDKLAIGHPSEIGAAFRRSRGPVARALQKLTFSRRLEEWIRGAQFEGWERHLKFLQETRRRYLEEQVLGTYCVLWHFEPDLPFPFDGKLVHAPAILARLIDDTPVRTRKGMELLKQGWIRAWLVGSGKLTNGIALDHALLALDQTWESKLEAVLQLLEPSLDSPGIRIEPAFVSFGTLDAGQQRNRVITVTGTGRGHLNGEIILEKYGEGLTLDRFHVEGQSTVLRLKICTLGLMPGSYANSLIFRTNAGEQTVKVKYRVEQAEDDSPWWQRLLD
jgi:hypothetical protein